MTDEQIITQAKATIQILGTMLDNICTELGIDPDSTKLTVYADTDELVSLTVTDAIERVRPSIEALNKIGF